MEKIIDLYTDGACTVQHEKQPGGWGAYLLCGSHKLELKGGELYTTNNRMEILSVIKGLQRIKMKDYVVKVYTDSAYLHNAFDKDWITGWVKNGWKTSKKKPVENQDLWTVLLEEMSKFVRVEYIKVKGHSTCEGNVIADKLAVQGKEEILLSSEQRDIAPETQTLIDLLNSLSVEQVKLAVDCMSESDRQRCISMLRKVCA